MKNTIPILMYHQVTSNIHPQFIPCSITPRAFSIHMKILKILGYNTINLNELEDYRSGKLILPRKPIVITFDDCYQESVDNAIPILRENGYKAIFYIPTDCAGSKSRWLLPEIGSEFPIIDWKTAKNLDSAGIQIGSHSKTHPVLTEISSEDCYDELAGSRKALEDHLGHEVVHLAYPYGFFDDKVRSIAAEAGYRTSCTVIERFVRIEDDPLALPRINVMGFDNVFDFILKLHFEEKYNTTHKLWLYTHGKMRGFGRLVKKIRAKFTKNK